MPTKSTYKPYSLSSSATKKHSLSITQFLGVDYNPSQIAVNKIHAVDMQNIIYKDRVNQKRTGYEQLANITPVQYQPDNLDGTYGDLVWNTTNVNGVWSFVGEDNQEHVIAHIGKILFEITGIGMDKNYLEFKAEPIFKRISSSSGYINTSVELEDYKSSAFVSNKKLYILGGNKYYVYRSNKTITPVESDEETYIPTTTIGITYADSKINEQTALDDVNLMTQWRKNKLVSGTYVDDGVSFRTSRFWDWQLDTSVLAKNENDINDIVIKITSLKEQTNEEE